MLFVGFGGGWWLVVVGGFFFEQTSSPEHRNPPLLLALDIGCIFCGLLVFEPQAFTSSRVGKGTRTQETLR